MEQITPEHSSSCFRTALRRLLKPAGDDPRFQSRELIKANFEPFMLECNKTYKEVHYLSIANQLKFEKALRRSELSPRFRTELEYRKILWERISDMIVWQIFAQQRHQVKRLSMRQPRRPLSACNPDAAISTLKQLNNDPFKVAIWTDATGIVDVGDILCRDFRTGALEITEVKDGIVNDDIFRTIKTSSCPWTVQDFLNRRGQKGEQQMIRVLDQIKLNSEVASILKSEKGFDPSCGQNIEVLDLTEIPEASWDKELRQVLKRCECEDGSLVCVDGALWVYAEIRQERPFAAVEQNLIDRIGNLNHPTASKWIREHARNDTFPALLDLQQWVRYIQSRPLFSRDLVLDDILSIIEGRKHVLMFLDWSLLSRCLAEEGIKLEWSSRKEGRREKSKPRSERFLLIGDRMPSLNYREATIQIGETHVVRMCFEGVRPSTVVSQFKKTFEILEPRSSNTVPTRTD